MTTHIRTTLISLLVVSALVVTGCAEPDEGEFRFEGVLEHRDCIESASPLDPSFFAARDRRDSVGVFAQSRPDVQSDADIVHIEVYDAAAVENRLGQPIELGTSLDDDPVVRGAVSFAESCPKLDDSFELRGQVVFDEIDTRRGQQVRGELQNASLVSVDSDEQTTVVADDVSGFWDFTVRVGAPYREYPTFEDEYPRSP